MKNRTVKAILVSLFMSVVPSGLFAQDAEDPQKAQSTVQEQASNDGFGSWDENADGYIDHTEFEAGISDQGNYDLYDSNSDGMIDDAEWRTARQHHDYLESDFYSMWDADRDGYLNRDEFNHGAHDRWDNNHDGHIDGAEYGENYADWIPY